MTKFDRLCGICGKSAVPRIYSINEALGLLIFFCSKECRKKFDGPRGDAIKEEIYNNYLMDEKLSENPN